jgi:cell division protein ZapA (FtsZ GTPase activity inhibitor)
MNRTRLNIYWKKWMLLLLPFIVCIHAPLAAQNKANKAQAQVTVHIADHTKDKNLILFDRNRKLGIRDFKGKPDNYSHGVGATYSGISMEMEGISKNGAVTVNITLTIYFDQTKSWMKPEGKTERVLAHEQVHFDLTAIKACDLAKAIEQGKFTSANIQQKIRDLQEHHTAVLSKLQQAYDKETKHGTIAEKQAEWSARVAEQLSASTCM